MSDHPARILFHPFSRDLSDVGKSGSQWLYLNAIPGFVRPQEFAGELAMVQGFRPYFNALKNASYEVTPTFEHKPNSVQGALVQLGRHRGQNEELFRQAWQSVDKGGLVVLAGGKRDGADAFRKRIMKQFSNVDHCAKFHGTAMWVTKTHSNSDAEILQVPSNTGKIDGQFHSAAGMFSHQQIDQGSKILADNLPTELRGHYADFCAGWGYLSARALEICPKIKSIDVYEADYLSLQSARINLKPFEVDKKIEYFWHDLINERCVNQYDGIIMNPPFHVSRAADPTLGAGMIKRAAMSLRPGGQLYMVANRQLPYEDVLKQSFKKVTPICEQQGFKVIRAAK